MSDTHTPRDGNKAEALSSDATAKSVAPAIPSESGVGEEDPGDFENASISAGDGERPAAPPAKPDRRRQSLSIVISAARDLARLNDVC